MLGEFEARIEAFVARHNHLRYHASTEATEDEHGGREAQSLAGTTQAFSAGTLPGHPPRRTKISP